MVETDYGNVLKDEEILSLISNFEPKGTLFPTQFVSIMTKVKIRIYDSVPILKDKLNTPKISKTDPLKETTYWYSPEQVVNKSVLKIPSIRDILEDISQYGNISKNYDEYYDFVKLAPWISNDR